MAILDILEYPDPRLRKVAKQVAHLTDEHQTLMDNMLETMYAAPGIGLAANQVNVQLRIVVMDVSEDKNSPLFLVNPVIFFRDGIEEMEEGCLSVPGIYEKVTRANHVKMRALDRNGQPFELEEEGILAVCIQHEIDHLDGKLFVDYLSEIKRNRARKKIEKERKHPDHKPEKGHDRPI